MNVKQLCEGIKKTASKSKQFFWGQGVMQYALELARYPLLEMLKSDTAEIPSKCLNEQFFLNGARDWKQYSEGCCSLVNDADIMTRLFPESKHRQLWKQIERGRPLNRVDNNLLDTQARALQQAWGLIKNVIDSTLENR